MEGNRMIHFGRIFDGVIQVKNIYTSKETRKEFLNCGQKTDWCPSTTMTMALEVKKCRIYTPGTDRFALDANLWTQKARNAELWTQKSEERRSLDGNRTGSTQMRDACALAGCLETPLFRRQKKYFSRKSSFEPQPAGVTL